MGRNKKEREDGKRIMGISRSLMMVAVNMMKMKMMVIVTKMMKIIMLVMIVV